MSLKRTVSPFINHAFKPSSWLANIDFIKRLVMTNHLLMVIMGEANGGKSTFVDLLRLKLEPAVQTVLVTAQSVKDEKELIQAFSTLLSGDTQDSSTIHEFFESLPTQSKPVLLVIDDAQYLSFELLRSLVFAYKDFGVLKRVHLSLVSDFSLTNTLQHLEQSGLKHFIHTIEPGVLTSTEARTYAMKYMQGKKGGESLFQPARFKTFYNVTQGKIALMNHYLNHFLSQKKQPNHPLGMLKKLTVLPLVLLGFFISISSGLYWITHRSLSPVVSIEHKLLVPQRELVSYHSNIPSWYDSAKIHSVEPPPLKKYVELLEDDGLDDSTNKNLVLVDKVLVMPSTYSRSTS